ncbi:MAG: cytochrome P450 [Actinomycetota bacterium]|nr:cytochrome P450 [Actinomycetota bacterium]
MKPSTRLPGPRGVAQVRHLRQIFRNPSSALDELRSTYGPVCGLGFGPARLAIVGDPVMLRELFSMPSERFRWGHKFNVLGFVVGPGSMIVSDGEDHRRRRSSVQTAFSRKRLNGWIPMIVDRTDHAIDHLAASAEPGGQVDLTPIVRTLVLTIAVHAFFGETFAERSGEIARLFERPQAYLESPTIRQLPHPLPFTARARVRADRRALDAILDTEIAQRRTEPTSDPLDLLAALAHDNSLSDAEIRDQVVTLIGAGYDTTAAAMAWMLWRSTTTPSIWSQLRAEADDVFGPLDHSATEDDAAPPDHSTLARLGYANRVMRESLRLHPPGAISPREAAESIQIGGHTIPKGTLVLWSAYLAGRDPNSWPDPLEFEPDRFSHLTPEQQAVTDQAWVPFGRGARNCIGFALAQMELTLIIARLAQRLDLTPPTTTIPRPVGMVINRPTGGAPFAITPRSTR